MNVGGSPERGFTVIETLIVLTVTGVLLVSAIAMINGRQGKTQFLTSIHGVQQQIQEMINEVTAGRYPELTGYQCNLDAFHQPHFTVASGAQGTNEPCIFLGKTLELGVPVNGEDGYSLYSMAGDRSADSMTAANPHIFPDGTEVTKKWSGGLSALTMTYKDSAGTTSDTAGVAFMAGDTSGSITPTGANGSGSQLFSLYAVNSTKLGVTTPAIMKPAINALGGVGYGNAQEVDICFQSGASKQSGLVTIGNTRGLAVSLKIYGNATCS